MHGKVTTSKYKVRMPANSRLAGLVRKPKEEDEARPLVPFVFAEVHLPRAKSGLAPGLRTRLPSSNWVFVWDKRRKTGYLLATPRSSNHDEMRFQVEWPGPAVADRPRDQGSGIRSQESGNKPEAPARGSSLTPDS
jgi:hypothetical protein